MNEWMNISTNTILFLVQGAEVFFFFFFEAKNRTFLTAKKITNKSTPLKKTDARDYTQMPDKAGGKS